MLQILKNSNPPKIFSYDAVDLIKDLTFVTREGIISKAVSIVTNLLLYRVLLPIVSVESWLSLQCFPGFHASGVKDFAKREKKVPGASRSFSLFLQAGLRDIYFRSVGNPQGVSEKQWQSFLVRRTLVNLSVNETGRHISRINYRMSFAASRKLVVSTIDQIRSQVLSTTSSRAIEQRIYSGRIDILS